MEKNYYLNPNIKRANVEEEYTDEQVKEYVRCSQDPIYFIEKYLKINALDEGLINFKLRGYQKNLIDTFQNHNKTIINAPRQSAKSTTTLAYILWFVMFNSDKTVAILANKAATARELLSRILVAYENMPYFLQPGAKAVNRGSLELANNSKIFASATSSTAIRGWSCNFLLLDEFAHIDNADNFFKSTYPVISSGKDTKVAIASTPNGLNLFYRLFTDAQKGLNEFKAFEIRWNEVPGRDDEWKKKQIAILGEHGFRQEFGNEFLGSSNSLIAGDTLRNLISATPIKEDENITVNHDPQQNHRYVAMCDVSSGVGEDYSTLTIIDITESPYTICLTWRSNEISPYDLPMHIIPICIRYNEAYLFVERNGIGRTVAEDCHFSYDYESLARTTMVNKRQTISGGFSKSDFGVDMSPIVKKIGCAALKNMIESEGLIDFTVDQVYELSNFVAYRKSFAADTGKHDDLVMNLVLFAWATKQKYFKELTDINIKEKEAVSKDERLPSAQIISSHYNSATDNWLFKLDPEEGVWDESLDINW